MVKLSLALRLLLLAGWLTSSASGAATPPGTQSRYLDSLISAQMVAARIPGLAACVVRGGELRWHGEYGFARLEDSIPVVDTTVFDLASVSKTATAAALMQLCERGRFALDDDVSASLPFAVRHPRYPDVPVTFRMLLTHTSGIADYWPTFQRLQRQGDPDVALRRFVGGYLVPGGEFYDAANNFCAWPPGGAYQYSNLGIALAGYLVEALSDSFHHQTRDSLFGPLGMDRTVWYFRDVDTNTMAMPYYYSAGRWWRHGHQSLPDVPAGTMKSSAPQLGRLLGAMLGWGSLGSVRVLDSATVALMTTIQYPAGIGLVWHHGYIGSREVWQHSGMWNGISTWFGFCRADNTGAVVLCNLAGVHGSILGTIAPALFDWAAGAAEECSEPVLHGTYSNLVRGVLSLRPTADGSRQELIDAAGRKAMDLRPGANDVSGIASGVYFVRLSGVERGASSLARVVVAR